MPNYEYIICDDDGKRTKGSITADSEGDVVAQLRKNDVVIVSIEEVKEKSVPIPEVVTQDAPAPAKPKKIHGKKIQTKDIVVFSRQFATMIDSGVPISQAMEALVEQTSNPKLQQILERINMEVSEGNGLSASFAQYPLDSTPKRSDGGHRVSRLYAQ